MPSALHVSELFTVTGSHTAPTAGGLPVRRKRPMPSNEITGAWSASNSHASICISLPWLTSPDPAHLRTTSGTTYEIEVVPVRAQSAESGTRRGCSADSQRGEPKVIGGEDVRERLARTVGVGRRSLPPHAVAVPAGDHGVSDPAADVNARPAAALTGSLTPCCPTSSSQSASRSCPDEGAPPSSLICAQVVWEIFRQKRVLRLNRDVAAHRQIHATAGHHASDAGAVLGVVQGSRFASTALARGRRALTPPPRSCQLAIT